MKTKETTGYLGDGGGGDGHSGSGPYRGPAARAQPGTSEGGAADIETAETTEDHGDDRGSRRCGGNQSTASPQSTGSRRKKRTEININDKDKQEEE